MGAAVTQPARTMAQKKVKILERYMIYKVAVRWDLCAIAK